MDYIKLHIRDIDVNGLLERLDFLREINTKTGEYKAVRIATYHNCTIKVYDSGRVQFAGSVHKMWNSLKGVTAPKNGDKGFNGNDLTLRDIYGIREHLKTLFDCKPSQLIFENIEVGVNLLTPFAVGLFLKGLLYHNGKRFESRRKDRLWQSYGSNYIVKAYDKGHQYGMAGNVLRFEIKVTRMEKFSNVGIKTFADVNNSTLNTAYNHLQKCFNEIVYYDRTIDKANLTRLESIKVKDYANVSYWMDMESKKRDRPKKKLAKLIEQYSENLKAQIGSLMSQKCVIINRSFENPKCVIINRSSIPLKITHSVPRICPITGADISMQKDDSYLLSNTGIKEIEKTDSALFERLKKILLTGNPNKFEKDDYNKMSKQIRNRFYNNPDRNNPDQTNLF